MLLPPWFDDPEQARPYFRRLRELRDRLVEDGIDRVSPARTVDGDEPRFRSGDPGRGHARARGHRDFRQTDCEDLMFEHTTPPRPPTTRSPRSRPSA